MPGKKRTSTAKQSAHSKRHKPSAGGAAGNKKKSAGASAIDPADRTAKQHKQANKKDRKGKGPAYIAVPGAKEDRRTRSDDDDEDDEERSGDDGAADGSEDEGMELDPDLVDAQGTDFLTRLDKKGMSASRPTLAEAYKKDKQAQPLAARKTAFSHVKVDAAPPTKSELKAAKKRDIERKKRLKARGEDGEPYDSADDLLDDEGAAAAPQGSGGKAHPDGELVDDLESDDFAFGSGSDDDLDDLSSMSEWSDAPEIDTGDDSLDDSDLGSEDDDEEGLWSTEGEEDENAGDEDGSELVFDSNEELGGDLDSEDDEEDEDEGDLSDADDLSDLDDTDPSLTRAAKKAKKRAPSSDLDDLEAKYEASRPFKKVKTPKALPTKLPIIENGKVVRSAEPLSNVPVEDSEDEEEEEEEERRPAQEYKSDPLGQRFGRPAVRQLLEIRDKKERIRRAREEIADLGREAAGTGEGEGGLNLLRRLLSLCAPKFNSSSAARSAGEKPILVDREIRIMAMVSLLAVFMDVVPGYRIRELSEAEKDVQVSQIVARQREWENGLVSTYKRFLEICEAEVTEDTPIAPAALHCLCSLAKEKTDFNFSVNILDVVVKRLGRKGWDEGHQICLDAVIYLFQNDTTTSAFTSLHLVRLISRLVRARGFAVRPEVISALLNLRLKDELGKGTRASADAVYREREGKNGIVRWNKEKNHRGRKGGKAKEAMSKKGSKKARQARKEQEQIDKEMREAEGEINQEERERNMTETLKLLFALYFRIVKLDYRSPLLPAALEGLARFAHLVNIDFFRDLLECLKGHIYRGTDAQENGDEEDDGDDGAISSFHVKRNDTREKLLCVVTAFELLQGQGESLNIDLGDFVSALYALILPLSLSPTFEEAPYLAQNAMTFSHRQTYKLAQTEADLLFRALSAIFLVARSLPSPIRTLAFAKRLLSASLNWPSASQLRTLSFLRSLLIREPRLEAMLETSDRRIDGRWRGQVDEPERAEPESTCFFEAGLFVHAHPDEKVRAEAKKLVNYRRE